MSISCKIPPAKKTTKKIKISNHMFRPRLCEAASLMKTGFFIHSFTIMHPFPF